MCSEYLIGSEYLISNVSYICHIIVNLRVNGNNSSLHVLVDLHDDEMI